MLSFIARLITTSLAVIIVAYLLPGVHVESALSAIGLALVLSLLNIFVKPLLILLTLPITVLTLGLFLLVVNALILLLAAELVSGFSIDGFWWALLFSIILSIVVSVLESFRTKSSRKE
ncbi:MAG: phage holin family protein [Bacteroidota bacterium]|nr:phage holin family protein [Bacteroidota bacterium]